MHIIDSSSAPGNWSTYAPVEVVDNGQWLTNEGWLVTAVESGTGTADSWWIDVSVRCATVA